MLDISHWTYELRKVVEVNLQLLSIECLLLKIENNTSLYEQVSVSSGIGRTEGPGFEMPLKW